MYYIMPSIEINGLVFIHIPKTAGVSITNWLATHFKVKHNLSNYIHPSTTMITNSFNETFAVVRNPWDRTVSLWAFYNKIKKTNIPFDEFVKNLHTYKLNIYSWFTFDQPQKAWIPHGVTYLLKFETLEEDFKVIQEKLGCFEPLEHLNSSEHGDYRTYYTPETWDIVSEVFKDDIEEFGYTN
jgi:hypothetical protein